MGLPYVALDWLWHCLYVFLWFSFMLHWNDCDIVILCFHGSSSCCLGLIVISFFSVFSWFIVMMLLIFVTLFIFDLMVLPGVALNWLWHWLSVFLWVCLMLHWIECDISYLCSYWTSSCFIGLIVAFFLSVFSWFFLTLHWIDCDIVYLCSQGSSSCRIGLIVALFICVLMVLTHVALDWLWQYLSVFLWVFLILHLIDCDIVQWFFLMLHWIDCDIVYLCSHGSSSCCIGLILTLFICVFMGLSYVALDWLWHSLSVFSWFFLMLPWIHCYIVCLCSYCSSLYCIGLIVILFFCVLMVLPQVALNWLWGCLSLFSWFFLILHGIDCDIVDLCSRASSSCCIWLIVILFICVLMVLPHVALDWLWHCLSVLSLVFIMWHCIDCDSVYLRSFVSSSFALDWLWHCLSVFLWFFSCCIGLILLLFVFVLVVLPHVALDWLWHC